MPVLFLSCSRSTITPVDYDDYNLVNTTAISPVVMKKMEGIYNLEGGSKNLGTEFVCKVSKSRVSFFSNLTGQFIVLKYGFKQSDGSVQFSGFWRSSELPDRGTIHFSLAATDGASDLLSAVFSNFKLSGTFGKSSISLRYIRAFSAFATYNPLIIFAHHGVQNFADPPFAENSLKGVVNCESYGVTGLEFDIRMTSDHVPICIHDANINTRLTQKGPFTGTWDQYPFPLITEYVRLIDGQKVPSLEEALNTFVDSTGLKYFWMDIKGNSDIFKYLEPIVRGAYARAAVQNRDIVIFAGLPSSDVITEFNKQPSYKSNNFTYTYSLPLPTLAEENIGKTLDNGCQYFGPRYTEGLLLNDVATAHTNNIKVISWTLNSKSLITDYLKNGNFDGFITDYPAYAVYAFYTSF